MKHNWQTRNFEDCLSQIVYTKKIPKKYFLISGKFPIVSQEVNLVNGYWDNKKDLFRAASPLILFGDHTKVFKYIDFDFVLGADGVKILKPKDILNPKFFYYQLTGLSLKDLGYARHFRILKEKMITYPSLSEQRRIVGILDEVFDKIEVAKKNAEKNLQNAKELFESYLQSVFTNGGDDWDKKTLKEISFEFARGKSKHRPRNDKKLYGGKYPFIQTGDIRNCNHYITKYSQTYNEIGLAQSKLWSKGTICITIAANIAETAILDFDACFPDSVIGIVVDPKITNNDFVEYLLQSFKSIIKQKGKGSAQDNINLATFEHELFPFPPLKTQKQIVAKLDRLSTATKKLEKIYEQKIADLEELKKSILNKAFAGEL